PTFVEYILEPVMQMFCGYGEEDYSLAWLIWLMAGRFAWSNNWWTFEEGGVGRLPREMGDRLSAMPDVRIHCNTITTRVEPGDDGVVIAFEQGGQSHEQSFDGVVVAVPGSQVLPLMPTLGAEHRDFFYRVEYVGHHIIYAMLDLDGAIPETSMLLPTAEGFRSLSNFHLTPTPDGHFLYGEIKGRRCAELVGASDADIMADALADLTRALPEVTIRAVADHYVQRNDIALCRRHVGYTRALATFKTLPPLPRVEFAGDYLLNSTVGQAHFTGLGAATRLTSRLDLARAQSAAASA
ncbi:MAG: FAD-dependent oxidoreductase, partial [Sphingopyxis sp.]|nr:FAD-dependent oxidoreductase [Sphingopyxis sp.]